MTAQMATRLTLRTFKHKKRKVSIILHTTCVYTGYFHKIFGGGGGDLLLGMIFGPRWGQSQIGGTSHLGRSQMRGHLEKLSAEAKNAPYSKIRANFDVLSIKYSFLMQFWSISSQNWEKNEVKYLIFSRTKLSWWGQALVKKWRQQSVWGGEQAKFLLPGGPPDPQDKKTLFIFFLYLAWLIHIMIPCVSRIKDFRFSSGIWLVHAGICSISAICRWANNYGGKKATATERQIGGPL